MQTIDADKLKKQLAHIKEEAAKIEELCNAENKTPFNDAIKLVIVCLQNINRLCEKILE